METILGSFLEQSFSNTFTIGGLSYPFPFAFIEEKSAHGVIFYFFREVGKYGRFEVVGNTIKDKHTMTACQEYLSSLKNGTYMFQGFPSGTEKIDIHATFPLVPEKEEKEKSTAKKNKSKKQEKEQEIIFTDPASIKAHLDNYVVGQDHPKKKLALAFSNYMTEVRTKEKLPRSHLLLIGPTGSGKTYLVSLLCEKAGLPFSKITLGGLSGEGFWGGSLSDVFRQIKAKTQEEAPYGVVFLDELDKIAQLGEHGWGPMIQNELIGYLDETPVHFHQYSGMSGVLNTSNLLFVAAGAFHGEENHSLENIIKKRLGYEKRIGFALEKEQKKNMLVQVTPQDLIQYGLKPELVGRLGHIGVLHALTPDEKLQILKNAKGSILKGITRTFELKGYVLDVSEDALKLLVSLSPAETGARGLETTCIDVFTEILYSPAQFADEKKIIHCTPELLQQLYVRNNNV